MAKPQGAGADGMPSYSSVDIRLVLHELFYPTTDMYACLDQLKAIHVCAWRDGLARSFTREFLRALQECMNRCRSQVERKRFVGFARLYCRLLATFAARFALRAQETDDFLAAVSQVLAPEFTDLHALNITRAVDTYFRKAAKCSPRSCELYCEKLYTLHVFAYNEGLLTVFVEAFTAQLEALAHSDTRCSQQTFIALYLYWLQRAPGHSPAMAAHLEHFVDMSVLLVKSVTREVPSPQGSHRGTALNVRRNRKRGLVESEPGTNPHEALQSGCCITQN